MLLPCVFAMSAMSTGILILTGLSGTIGTVTTLSQDRKRTTERKSGTDACLVPPA